MLRRISAWVAIGVVPTVIGGLFGMNLGGIPGGDTPSASRRHRPHAVLCVWLYRRFKDADWL